jgi:hypothetical protein
MGSCQAVFSRVSSPNDLDVGQADGPINELFFSVTKIRGHQLLILRAHLAGNRRICSR